MSGRMAIGLAAIASGLVTFVLVLRALLPGVAFWDTAEFQTVGPLLGSAHPTGFPAYVTLGWLASIVLAPIGEPALRMNALAALLGATAAGLVAILVGQLTGRALLAAGAGLLYGALPVAWGLATHADPHGLHAVLVALLLVLLLGWERRSHRADMSVGRSSVDPSGADRWLVGAAVVLGVSVANHSLTWLLAPGIALFVLAVEPRILARRRLILTCAAVALAVAALLYLELPLRAGPFRAPLVYGRPDTFVGFWSIAFGLQFAGVLVEPSSGLLDKAADLVRFGGDQLGALIVLVPLGFAATALRRPRFALLTTPAFLITCWFAAWYTNAEIARYYLVPAMIVVAWIAILIDGVIEAASTLLGDPFPVDGGVSGPGRARRSGRAMAVEGVAVLLLLVPTLAALPARAVALDRSHETAAADWLDATLARLQPNAVVVSWWNFSTPLWYAQLVQGRRTDVRVVDDRTRLDEQLGDVSDVIDANLGRRPVYLIRLPAELPALEARYRLEYLDGPSYQPLVRVLGRREGSS